MRRTLRVMKKAIIILLVGLMATLCFGASNGFAVITWDDGLVHTVDTDLSTWDFDVYDNVNPPYEPTKVNVLYGGKMSTVKTYENTRVNSSGGFIGALYAYENTELSNSGGEINWLYSYNSTYTTVNGGYFQQLLSYDNSKIGTVNLIV